MKISARNQIPGSVKMIKKGPVSTEVVMTVAAGYEIVSSITTHSAEHLKLKEGSKSMREWLKVDVPMNASE